MAEMGISQLLSKRATFVGLCFLVIFFKLLPLNTVPTNWAGPDLIIALTFCWALRRPNYVPALSVAIVMLVSDLLFQRPPGLLALLIVLATQHLKLRARGLREASFLSEWTTVAFVLAVVTLINWLVLTILIVQQAPLGLSLLQMIMTLLFYPAVVAFSQVAIGVRKSAPGELNALGRLI